MGKNISPEMLEIALVDIAAMPPCAAELEKVDLSRAFDIPQHNIERALQFIAKAVRPSYPTPPPFRSLSIKPGERAAAKIAPRCIVDDYLFADVALLSAAGGTGKTTLVLFEIVHIILGRPLYGLAVKQPGPVILITAEDPRSILLGRLHRIIGQMDLTEAEQAAVERDLIIWDVSGEMSRLVEISPNGSLTLTGMADAIIDQAGDIKPVMIVMDPIISFGPGETRVNDAEQMLVLAGRRIVRALDCCVRYIAHVSQASANNGTRGQYATRGGTALPDGARMVAVLNRYSDDLHKEKPPHTLEREAGDTLLLLDRPKISYGPRPPTLWLSRQGGGWTFTSATPTPEMSPEANRAAQCDQVEAFLTSNLKEGRRFTKNQIEEGRFIDLNRKELRISIAELMVSGRVVLAPLPKSERKNMRTSYLHPVRLPIPAEHDGGNDEKNTDEVGQ